MKSVSGITIGVFVGLLILSTCLMCASHIFKKDNAVYAHTPYHVPHEVIRTRDCPTPTPRCEDNILSGLDGIESVRHGQNTCHVIKGTDITIQRLISDLAGGWSLRDIAQNYRVSQEGMEEVNRFLVSLAHKLNRVR